MDTKKVITDGNTAMKKAVDHTLHEFHTLNVGKAQPSMVENILVEVYGTMQPLKNAAAIMTPDARSIVIQPFDKGTSKDICKAIQAANIGINPVDQGAIIRCPIPELTTQRRAELAKVAHKYAEEGKVRVRNARRDILEVLKKGQKDKLISEDEFKRTEKEIQAGHDKCILDIDKALKQKETDLQKV